MVRTLPPRCKMPMTAVLSLPPVPVMRRCRFTDVHIARLAADESFVGFDMAGELVSGGHAESAANAVIHEPCGLLSHADGPGDLVAADAVLAVHYLPHGEQPFVQAERRILKDGSGLESELAQRVFAAALPAVVLRLEQNFLAAAPRTATPSGQQRRATT